ncbi:MAG: hypothetical protein HYR49_06230 [Gammaproteobacteria bacterium]|nr:hypothetical protein [Gammaproteobacteria bacterium]
MTRLRLPPTDPLEITRQLYRQAVALRSPAELESLIAFFARFRRFSIFNTALIHVQRPAARLLASAAQWARLDHEVNDGAPPVIVLAPFGPVQFLFDESDTTGRALADVERATLLAPGPAPHANWEQTVEGAKVLGVMVEAGQVAPNAPWRLEQHRDRGQARGEGKYISWELAVDGSLGADQRFVRLAHELGHIYCGHLGGHPNGAWRSRRDVSGPEREAEAELVCHLVCARAARAAPTAPELRVFMETNGVATLDLGAVISAADLVESRSATRKSGVRPQKPSDPLPGQMAMFN